jgi:hypothetical protein
MSRPVLPMILLSRAHAADSPRYSKKCASLTSQPSAPRSWPEVAMVRIVRARNAIPHQVGALHRLRAPQRLGRRWTDTFQTRAGSSPSGKWAALVRDITVHSTTEVDPTGRFRATSHCAKIENASNSWSNGPVVMHLRTTGSVGHHIKVMRGHSVGRNGALGRQFRNFKKCAKSESELSAL